MLDIKFIRENPALIEKTIQLKQVNLSLNKLLELDTKTLELKKKLEILLTERNLNAKKVPLAKDEERKSLIEHGRALGTQIEELKKQFNESEEALKQLLWIVPNIPAPDAPIGKDENDNVEVKKWGTIFKKDFEPLSHIEILHKRDWAFFEKMAVIAGSRTYSLKNELVQLEVALLQFAMDKLRSKQFCLITTPSFTREFALYGTGHFPLGKDQVYHLSEDDLYLSGTSEVALNSIHAGEILEEATLPLLYAGYSSCFRREAGSAGKDVKGLIRVHQFTKVEQYILCKNDPEESAKWQSILLEIAEEIMQELKLPYRIVECCTGDMGLGKVKMFDIEAWVPSENKYRETHSCSRLHDWQARRSNLRYRDAEGVVHFCHTLNNTAIASPRILVPFLENHQDVNGRIFIPELLRPFLFGKELL